MANIQINKKVSKGRTFIQVAATPKSPETRALLKKFQAGVSAFQKKWKAIAKAKAKAAK